MPEPYEESRIELYSIKKQIVKALDEVDFAEEFYCQDQPDKALSHARESILLLKKSIHRLTTIIFNYYGEE